MLYRVDYRLRPEGSAGRLASSLERLTGYLTSRAAAWELAAYLKLRPVAGDGDFGAAARADIVRSVFDASRKREHLREELRAMRLQLERERGQKGRNIKWGVGGMTDVYFATRYLQLRDEVDFPPEQGTVALVRHLERVGSLDAATSADFAEGYALLRRLDHHIRLIGDRHAPGMPESPEFAEEAAAATGFSNPAEYETALQAAMGAVRAAFERVFVGTAERTS
jgi:glutamate-ammonia-ligase adenylyltransferase